MKIVVTGGAGFIGSHFIDQLVSDPSVKHIYVIDALTYAGNLANLQNVIQNPKFHFLHANIRDISKFKNEISSSDILFNFAAESHVDRSIESPSVFFQTNTLGVGDLLDFCLDSNVGRFVQVSTDEVYGPIRDGFSRESDPLKPSSPYAASKAAADLYALSYFQTYQMDVVVTRGCNTYGPRQFPEKLIPLMISRINNNMPIPIYGDGTNVREWMHVHDHAAGIWSAGTLGSAGEIFNLGSGERFTNLEVADMVLKSFGRGPELLTFVQDRKGHDVRYALDSSKALRELSWNAKRIFTTELDRCSTWNEV